MAKKSYKKDRFSASGESNPFNVHVNRQKHSFLGQAVKGTRGFPGVSRAVGHAKRRELWHKKKVKAQKANRFLDKRFVDSSVPLEERNVDHLVRERKKKLKKYIFNLNDEEELTHKGMPLHNVKSFDDAESGSEDEHLDANFVNRAHFGGFPVNSALEPPKSHKEIIDQLILESKQKKQEKKIENEITAELTDKLDNDWKEILTLMSGIKTGKPQPLPEKNDPYDILAQELKFELRGMPATRIKSPEEIAKEEKDRLCRLEEERLIRMVDDKNEKRDNHLSADSIYDGFDLEPVIAVEDDSECSENMGKSEDDSEGEILNDSQSAKKHAKYENKEKEVCSNDNYLTIRSAEDFSSEIPGSLNDFKVLIGNSAADDISKVIEKILKHNLLSKSEKNLKKLETFFSILIEYTFECCQDSGKNVNISSVVFPHLYLLAEVSPLNTGHKLLFYLDQEQALFQECKGKKMKKNFPRLQSLLLLKLCSILYSVSDFRHPVITPAMLFMCDILTSAYCITLPNILSRLFISRIIMDCESQSKRLIPETLLFLNKSLDLAVIKRTKDMGNFSKGRRLNLIVSKKLNSEETELLNLLQLDNEVCDDSKKIGILLELTSQLHHYAVLYTYLPSYSELFFQTLAICRQLPVDRFPVILRNSVNNLMQVLSKQSNPLSYLTFQNIKPKPLKLFEPSFDSKFSDKDNINKKRRLVKQVSQKIKKEERTLLKEMRKEAQMVASEKLNEMLEADQERKRKVKQLYQELAMQEGEFKKFAKKQ